LFSTGAAGVASFELHAAKAPNDRREALFKKSLLLIISFIINMVYEKSEGTAFAKPCLQVIVLIILPKAEH
jgi:hypothetical protein